MECGCGCGEDLTPRKNGTFATYKPGHDSKHKAMLVKLARDGDKTARSMLQDKGWMKYLEKGAGPPPQPEKTAEQKKKSVAKPTKLDKKLYGLSPWYFQLLKYPPTQGSWYCEEDHSSEGPLINPQTRTECWYCNERKPEEPRMVFPEYEKAVAILENQDWDKIHEDAALDERFPAAAVPKQIQTARQMIRFRETALSPNGSKTKEVWDEAPA